MTNPIIRVVTSTALTSDDVVTLDSAIRWLRAQGIDDQSTILECVQGAVQEAEERTNRTLRQSITRTVYFGCWQYIMQMPSPPLISVSSVKYYDEANTLQTVSSADYSVRTQDRGPGWIEFASDYDFATTYNYTAEPIQIEIVTGYGSAAAQLPLVKTAIRLLVIAAHDLDASQRNEAYRLLQNFVYRG